MKLILPALGALLILGMIRFLHVIYKECQAWSAAVEAEEHGAEWDGKNINKGC